MRVPPVQTRRFTRAEYDRLIEQGFFDEDERIELLDAPHARIRVADLIP